MAIKTIFFDLGGVVLTNGWDYESRKRAMAKFGLDERDFGRRHEMLRYALDTGRINLRSYLEKAVFNIQRNFTHEDFLEFMKNESQELPGAPELVRSLRALKKYPIFALNNESLELHEYRVQRFNLHELFDGFLSSCYLGHAKPEEEIYSIALGIAHSKAEECVFIDDRGLNVESAAAVGFNTIHHKSVQETVEALKVFGIAL